MPHLLHAFKNGDFDISIFSDGTKIREGGGRSVIPESLDVKITNWCDGACTWCHEKSNKRGEHADLNPTINLLTKLPAGVEIAIGGGHAMAHPEFDYFVEALSAAGLICNVTVNEKHFQKELSRLEKLVAKQLIRGIGYSYSEIPCTWKYDNLVSHVIIGVTSPTELMNIIQVNNKVLLLGYKNFGRGIKFNAKHEKTVKENIDLWYRWLFKAARRAHLSFDNLAIEQIQPKRLFTKNDYDTFYMGDDGSHSMYLDAVKQEYAKSSISYRTAYHGDIRDMFKIVGGKHESKAV